MTFPAKSRIFEPAPESKSLLVLFFRKELLSCLRLPISAARVHALDLLVKGSDLLNQEANAAGVA
jgi:hypothetical protein